MTTRRDAGGRPTPGPATRTPDTRRPAAGRRGVDVSIPDPIRGRGIPVARCIVLRPAPGRRLMQPVVQRCPVCLGGHSHRCGDAPALKAGKVYRRCPTTGRKYRLSVRWWTNTPRREIRPKSEEARHRAA